MPSLRMNVEPNVERSLGPSGDPNSQFCTSNSLAHDLKIPYQAASLKAVVESGFTKNATIPKSFDTGKAEALQLLSHSMDVHSMRASVWGEQAQADGDLEEDASVTAAIAQARAKRLATGFKSNSDPFVPSSAPESPARPPILLVKQRMGNKDPLMKENDWHGPAYMSTTSKQAYTPKSSTDVDCMEGKEVDLYSRRCLSHGACQNEVNTVQFAPQPKYDPISEMKDKYRPMHIIHAGDSQPGSPIANLSVAAATNGPRPIGHAAIDHIRQFLFQNWGIGGMRNLTMLLRGFGSSSASVGIEKLFEALEMLGLNLSTQESEELIRSFDRARSGTISVENVVAGIRGRWAQQRMKLVEQAWKQLNPNGQQLSMKAMVHFFDPVHHPEVSAGAATPKQIVEAFISHWEKDPTDAVSFMEFEDYYKDIGALIDNDDFFELLIRNTWHISGGVGAAGCTSCRRVLVTFIDGRRSVESLHNDLRISLDDLEAIQANLEAQGISGIASVAPVDSMHGMEPGALQLAAYQNRAVHRAQEAKGTFVPFRNSALSTYNLISGDAIGSPPQSFYPTRLSPRREAQMARKDPVEFSVYCDQDRMQSTSHAMHMIRKDPYRTSVDEVLMENDAALQLAQGAPTAEARCRLMTGHPRKELLNAGYATNNQMAVASEEEPCRNPRRLNLKQARTARVANRLAYESEGQTTIYRSDFREQSKVPLDTTNLIELRKQPTGYTFDNAWHVLPLVVNADDDRKNRPRKLGIPMVDAIRQALAEKGVCGFRSFVRILRAMDQRDCGAVQQGDLETALHACGIGLTSTEMEKLLSAANISPEAGIPIVQLLEALRGPLSDRRLQLIRLAYSSLDKQRTNAVPVQEMIAAYNPLQHPDVLRKRRTSDQVMQEFIAGWDLEENVHVSFADFKDYYADVNVTVENDDFFELLMRNCWRIP
eukprot:GGOE01021637.1.p1 GENE.GGOE01021637.1~~GGOE01021637.1.p1  ORF type:complete len:937 (+),score=122.24 GGOE01021637.1:36-2846(+)